MRQALYIGRAEVFRLRVELRQDRPNIGGRECVGNPDVHGRVSEAKFVKEFRADCCVEVGVEQPAFGHLEMQFFQLLILDSINTMKLTFCKIWNSFVSCMMLFPACV